MHETVFSKEIVTIINSKLKELDAGSRVSAVCVRLSPLSHVKPQALQEAFLQLVSGSELDTISLDVKPAQIRLQCRSCAKVFMVISPLTCCPECSSDDLDITCASEFFVESIQVQKE